MVGMCMVSVQVGKVSMHVMGTCIVGMGPVGLRDRMVGMYFVIKQDVGKSMTYMIAPHVVA